jgi:hypothetical protein
MITAKNIQSHVVEEVITHLQKQNDEFLEQQDILSVFVDKCANFDIKCRKFIQKPYIINTDPTIESSNRVSTSNFAQSCSFCDLTICSSCINSKDDADNELNVYDICDSCYKQMCFRCINKNMLFCSDCGLACICSKCCELQALYWNNENYGKWICNYCKSHPKQWEKKN